MERQIYISCDFNERDLQPVKSICSFLESAGCRVQFAPSNDNDFYRNLEDLIESCDAFVAIVGDGYQNSSWLNHELYYAHALNKYRFSPRPRILAVRMGEAGLPKCSAHIKAEWIDEQKYNLLLEDLPWEVDAV